MGKGNEVQSENLRLGRLMIDTALKMEDNLAELLSVQVMHMKQLAGKDLNEEIISANKLLRNIIFSLMLTDERIVRGLELCGIKNDVNKNKPSWLARDQMVDPG